MVYLSQELKAKNCVIFEMFERLVKFMKAFQVESNFDEQTQDLINVICGYLNEQVRINLGEFYPSLLVESDYQQLFPQDLLAQYFGLE